MPRAPRLHFPGGIYHVILRGNHRLPIFFCHSDRDHLGQLVAEAIERFGMRVHAYCWMPNHIHLAMQVADTPLGPAMRRIASRYARAVQRRQPTTGHLFERRYHAVLVDADSYLLELVRYIHLNPVRGGIVTDPANYVWSGHRTYLALGATPWLTTDFALRLFARENVAAREAYRRFVMQGIGVRPDPGLISGGRDERRVLGDDRFLSQLASKIRHQRPSLSLDSLVQQVCESHSIAPEELTAGGRQRKPAKARAVILWHATRLKLATLSDLARRFQRSPSTLVGSLELYRRSQPDLFADSPRVE